MKRSVEFWVIEINFDRNFQVKIFLLLRKIGTELLKCQAMEKLRHHRIGFAKKSKNISQL